jgi:phytoene synthase
MTSQVFTWEHQLLSWAHQCIDEPASTVGIEAGPAEMAAAYRQCEAVTAEHSRTFHLASRLLPPAKRRAARALYAFCRRADDLVDRPAVDPRDRPTADARDRPTADALAALEGWRAAALSSRPRHDDPVALAWADTRARYRIPSCYPHQLFEGVSRDLQQTRYATFDELAEYAYGVASTVGLMTAHIIGFAGPPAIPYAVKLGVALQITNILRDIGEDWRAGRLYLPQDELVSFGLCEGDIAAGRVDDRWRAFMRFQIARNRALYDDAWPGIALLNRDGRFAIAAAAVMYRGILDDIEAHDMDVFSRRAHLGAWGKLRRLPAAWREVR